MRRCVDCRGDCYGWSEHSRCDRCEKVLRARGPLEVEPGSVAAEVRARRLERFAATEARLGHG